MLFSRSENSEFKARRRKRKPIALHPLFVPALALWGALFAGLAVMVLPAEMINQITTASALGALGGFARYFFAAIAGLIGAGCGYFVATKWRGMLPGRSEAMMEHAAEHVRPIDPASELGSESLDTPIEEDTLELEEASEIVDEPADDEPDAAETVDTLELGEEFEADVPAQPDDPLENEAFAHSEDEDDVQEEPEPETEPASLLPIRRRRNRGKPVELVQALGDHRARQAAMNKDMLDLGEFSLLAEKNRKAQTGRLPLSPAQGPAAIDKLRAVPPQDLSLVQMVERLAVALRERQEAARKVPQSEQSAERDAALVEALKALSLFTEQGLAEPVRASNAEDGTERELRDALSKLQTMRGAA